MQFNILELNFIHQTYWYWIACIYQFQANHQENLLYQPVSLISFPCFSFLFVCLFFFFLKGFLKARLSNAINIALLYFVSSDGTTEESSISGKLYMLFAFIEEGGGGNYACKIKRLTPTIWTFKRQKQKQAFIFLEIVGIYGRNGQANLIPWGERNEGVGEGGRESVSYTWFVPKPHVSMGSFFPSLYFIYVRCDQKLW